MPTMADRRKATDQKIYNAAVVEFGKNGYSNTTLSMIAKSAGITPGLIVQNFGSKEDLFKKIAIDISVRIYEEFKNFSKIWDQRCREVIAFILGSLSRYPDALNYLNFYVSLITSLDTPDIVLKEMYEQYRKSPVSEMLIKGQKDGEVIEGDPFVIYGLFWSNAFNTIRMCFSNSLEYPQTEWFLDIIRKH